MVIHQVKVSLVGDGAVGKTAITQSLTTGEFTASYKMTIGLNIAVHKREKNGTQVHFALWDLGGQPRFNVVRAQFYNGSKIIIFVYDITNKGSFENLPNWLKEVNKHCRTPYTGFLVGNKIDLSEFRIIKFETAKEYAESLELEYIETSAREGIGISELIELLTNNIIENSSQESPKRIGSRILANT